MINDKAGKRYWNDTGCASEIPNAVNPHQLQLSNYINRRFHEYFCQAFSSIGTEGKRILEIGCGRSQWLPYFTKEFAFRVYGIVYFDVGCRQARQILFNPGSTLSQRIVRGGFWIFLLRIVQQLFGLTRFVIIAPILSPNDFGLMGIALLAMATLETFSQTGFQQALIQKKVDIRPYLDSARPVLILRSFILFAILFLIAPYFKNQREHNIEYVNWNLL